VYVGGTTDVARIGVWAFLVKYTPEGELLWEETWYGRDLESADAVAVDTQDNLYLAGPAEEGNALLMRIPPTAR